MKRNTITTLAIATSLALPATLFGQAQSSQSQSQNQNRNQAQSPSTWSQQQAGSSMSVGQIERVSEDKLEQKITAERVIGKEVVDNQGQKIGKVKDVGLSQALEDRASVTIGSQMGSSGAATRGSGVAGGGTHAGTGTSAGASASVGTGTSAGTATTPGTATSPGQSGTAGSSASQGGISASAGRGEVQIYVSVDAEELDVGDDLLSIPASHLSYDKEEDQFRLNVSRDSLRTLAQASQAGEANR